MLLGKKTVGIECRKMKTNLSNWENHNGSRPTNEPIRFHVCKVVQCK